MKQFSKKKLVVFALVTVAGALLHFLHNLLPNPVTALISPVNESLWEHVKIVYWPLLVAMLVLTRGKRAERGAWSLAIVAACVGMLVVGYGYHVLLGGESMVFDIVLYVLVMALAFVLAEVLNRPAVQARGDVLMLVLVALGCAVVLFTFLPPPMTLFADLSGAKTWGTIPH